MRELPLAVRFDGSATWREGHQTATTDFELPWTFKIVSGGPISRSISYYVYGTFEKGHSVNLEDAYVQSSSVFNLPVDLLVGQFQVCDPLFKRELRLEREDYHIYTTRVGLINTNLAYDRGAVLVWTAPGKVDVVAHVVNGNGSYPIYDGSFDDNGYKNTFAAPGAAVGPCTPRGLLLPGADFVVACESLQPHDVTRPRYRGRRQRSDAVQPPVPASQGHAPLPRPQANSER